AEFVAVSCPACRETKQQEALAKYGFRFVSCPICYTLYMSPRPSARLMADYYAASESYAYWAKYIFPASEAARREKVHKLWLDRVLDYCESYGVRPGTLVEVGPGFGTFASVAIESGRFEQVLAIEPTPELAKACRARGVTVIEKRVGDVAQSEIP